MTATQTLRTEAPTRTDTSVPNSDYLKVFEGVAQAWRLSVNDRLELLKVNERTYYRWRHTGPKLSEDQRLRISYVLNVYFDLQSIFDSEDAAIAWISSPNEYFSEQPPLHLMKGSTVDLYHVYAYVHNNAP